MLPPMPEDWELGEFVVPGVNDSGHDADNNHHQGPPPPVV